MLAADGKPLRSMLMSELAVATALVAELLPPEPVPPLVSLVAPVTTDTFEVPEAVGVPETVQEMLLPTATVAGVVGVHVPSVTPAGRPDTAHVALTALAVAVALLVHRMVPV